MKYKDFVEKYGVLVNIIKLWKQWYGWEWKKGVFFEKSVYIKKVGVLFGNKNVLGNNGGVLERNWNVVLYGFFLKYLLEEMFEIMEEI